MMVKDRGQRFQTPAELSDALTRFRQTMAERKRSDDELRERPQGTPSRVDARAALAKPSDSGDSREGVSVKVASPSALLEMQGGPPPWPTRASASRRGGRTARTLAHVLGGAVLTAAVLGFGVWLLLPWMEFAPPPAVPSPAARIAASVATTAPHAPIPQPSSALPQARVPEERHGELALDTRSEPKPAVEPSTAELRPDAVASKAPRRPESLVLPPNETLSNAKPRAERLPERTAASDSKSAGYPEPMRFDFGPSARRLVKLNETLDKVLAAPQAHADQFVIPAGMYELVRSRDDRLDGPRKYSVTELRYESTRPGGSRYYLISGATRDLELEPRLAGHLDALHREQLENKPAMLTLRVTKAGACALVAVEILQKPYPRLRSGIVPDMEYETLAVGPDGARPAKGDDKDWETERMLKLARYYKGLLRAHKPMFQYMQMGQIQAAMTTIWGNVMREAAAQDAQQRALQQKIGGR